MTKNKEKNRRSNPKVNNISTPWVKVTENSWIKNVNKEELPQWLRNFYKKYLTVQEEKNRKREQSPSLNEFSKTLSIDTFTTEQALVEQEK